MIIGNQFQGNPPADPAETEQQVKDFVEVMIPALDEASKKLHMIGTGSESSWSADGTNSR